MNISFIVPAVPIAQPRQRHRIFKGKDGQTYSGNYTPAKSPVNSFKASVQHAARLVYSGPPLAGPLSMLLVFVMPRPKNMLWKTRPMPRAWHAKKPDDENLIKSFQDALTGLAWIDDSQICRLWMDKWIASGDEQPHVEVEIMKL